LGAFFGVATFVALVILAVWYHKRWICAGRSQIKHNTQETAWNNPGTGHITTGLAWPTLQSGAEENVAQRPALPYFSQEALHLPMPASFAGINNSGTPPSATSQRLPHTPSQQGVKCPDSAHQAGYRPSPQSNSHTTMTTQDSTIQCAQYTPSQYRVEPPGSVQQRQHGKSPPSLPQHYSLAAFDDSPTRQML
jgi:hypothetical protein